MPLTGAVRAPLEVAEARQLWLSAPTDHLALDHSMTAFACSNTAGGIVRRALRGLQIDHEARNSLAVPRGDRRAGARPSGCDRRTRRRGGRRRAGPGYRTAGAGFDAFAIFHHPVVEGYSRELEDVAMSAPWVNGSANGTTASAWPSPASNARRRSSRCGSRGAWNLNRGAEPPKSASRHCAGRSDCPDGQHGDPRCAGERLLENREPLLREPRTMLVKPVTLPLGRARFATSFVATGRRRDHHDRMVFVPRMAARVATDVAARRGRRSVAPDLSESG